MPELGQSFHPDNLPVMVDASSLPDVVSPAEEVINTLTPYLAAIDMRAAEIKGGTNLGYKTNHHTERKWQNALWKKFHIYEGTSWQNTLTVDGTQFIATSTLDCPEKDNYVSYLLTEEIKDTGRRGARLTITNDQENDVVDISYKWWPGSVAYLITRFAGQDDFIRVLKAAQDEYSNGKALEYTMDFSISSLRQTPSLEVTLHQEDKPSDEELKLQDMYKMAGQSLVTPGMSSQVNTDVGNWGPALKEYRRKRNHEIRLNLGQLDIDNPQLLDSDRALPAQVLQAILSIIPAITRKDAENGKTLTLANPKQHIASL